MSIPWAALAWRMLDEADLPALAGLASACLSADGGQPFAASPAFLRRCYLSDAESCAGLDGATLVCVSSLRLPPPDGRGDEPAVTTGLVHPAWRRRGIGGHAFDWAVARAGAAAGAAEASGWIAQVGVVPQARGNGIGALLITEAVRRMRAAGETAITLNVNINNPRAAALYRRLGFTVTGRRARYQAWV